MKNLLWRVRLWIESVKATINGVGTNLDWDWDDNLEIELTEEDCGI